MSDEKIVQGTPTAEEAKVNKEQEAAQKELEELSQEIEEVLAKPREIGKNGYALQPFVMYVEQGVLPRVRLVPSPEVEKEQDEQKD